jgi:hypothetical protein
VYPKVEPGSEIVVPRMNVKEALSQKTLASIQMITGIVSSLSLMLVTIRQFK